MRKFRFLACIGLLVGSAMLVRAQETFPENGVADPRHGHYAFINATIVKDASTTLTNATLVIKDGKIVAVGSNLKTPAGAVEVDCKGKYIYPSFIDLYADYGTAVPQRTGGGGGFNLARHKLNPTPKVHTDGTRQLRVKPMHIACLRLMIIKQRHFAMMDLVLFSLT